jgi:release factor glutamine methyltransferase
MDVRSALKQGIAQLRRANISSHTLAAELLLLHATGRSRTSLYSHPEDELSEIESQNYFVMIERRAVGVPTQHLTGKQEFWGLEFEVNRDVLVPRPETEHVIEVALDRLALRDLRSKQSQNMSGEGLLIADIGTGSGCIAIALAKELPAANIYALDISPAALAVAQRNAARLGFQDRINFLESDLLEKFLAAGAQHAAPRQDPPRSAAVRESSFAGRQSQLPRQMSLLFDLIVSNPPYVALREAATLLPEVRDHEPSVALFGGEAGYELYAGLIAQSAARLKPGGFLVLELGHDSLPAVRPLVLTPAWVNVGVTNDLAGVPRVISAERTDNL